MLTGLPPFYTPNREELFKKIKFYTLRYPDFLSENVKSLLDGLFQKDPDKRLGGGAGGADEIKTHPWFAQVDWNAYLRKEIKAPFIPIIKSDMDVSNFDTVTLNFCSAYDVILGIHRGSNRVIRA